MSAEDQNPVEETSSSAGSPVSESIASIPVNNTRFANLVNKVSRWRQTAPAAVRSAFIWCRGGWKKLRERFERWPRRIQIGVVAAALGGATAAYFLPTILAFFITLYQAPQVIAVFPPDGAVEVERSAKIEITFSVVMDRASVEQALRLSSLPPEGAVADYTFVDGSFEWLDERRVVFQPRELLGKDTQHTIQIGDTARAGNGRSLTQFTSTFTTLGDPRVVFSSPRENSELDTLITVMFDRPMVSLTTAQANEARANILKVEPAVAGVGKWVGSSSFIFRPSERLTPSTKYTATVEKGIESPVGDVFDEDYSFSFVTERPMVHELSYLDSRYASYYGREHYYSVYDPTRLIEERGPRQPWKVDFSLDMNRASVEGHFALVQKETDMQISVRFEWESDQTVMIEPTQELEPLAIYQARFDAGMEGIAGNYGTEEDFAWEFKVVDLPGLVSTTPNDGQINWGSDNYERSSFALVFKSPMDAGALTDAVIVSPEPETRVDVNAWTTRAGINFWQKPSTEYTITIPQATKDLFGRELPQSYTIRFTTAPLPKTIGLISSNSLNKYIAIQNARITPRIAAKVTNVTTIDFELYQITDDQLIELIAEKENTSELALIWQNLDLTRFDQVHAWSNDFEVEPDVPVNVVTEVARDGQLFPPGVYFLEAKIEGGTRDNLILVLSNTGLLFKTSPDQVFTWATDLSTGQPVPDMELKVLTLGKQELARGKTNPDGVFQDNITWPTSQYGNDDRTFVAIGRDAQDVALVTWEFNQGIQNYNFGTYVYGSGSATTNNVETFVTFDRPIYRPGQEVYFKGYLRFEEDAVYSLPTLETLVEVTVGTGYGKSRQEIYRQTLPVDEFGSFTDSVVLDEDLATGEYTLQGKYKEKIFSRSFRVEDYRKPDYQALIESDQEKYVVGEQALIALEASYFGGGGVAHAPVTYEVSQRGEYYAWSEDIGYIFNQPNFVEYPYSSYRSSFIDAEEGTGTTDSQGRFTTRINLTQDPDKGQAWNTTNYVVAVGVQDVNNQTVGNETEFTVYASSRQVGIKPSRYFGHQGERAQFELVTLDTDERRVPRQSVTWEVYERVWTNIQELGDDGKYYTKSEPVDTLADQGQTTTDGFGQGSFAFTPDKAGYYVIKAQTQDAQRRVWETAFSYWVAAEDALISFKKVDHDRIDLLPERSEYQVGEQAAILAPLPFNDAKGLVTIERRNVLDYQLVDLPMNAQDFAIEIKERHVPNIFVSLTAVKGGDSLQNLPEFRTGLTRLLVDVAPRELNLTIETNKERYKPREVVEYQVVARDASGSPVKGDFSLAVVDKAVLSLSNENLANILQEFYFERGLSVNNVHSLTASLEKLIVSAGLGAKGGSGSAGYDDARRDTSRKKFLDTVIFEANLRTDENGQAAGSFELPDNLTTFNFLLIGSDKETRVGSASKDILVAQDLYIRPILPRFEVWGDSLQIGAVIQNQTDRVQDISVSVETSGMILTDNTETLRVSVGPSGAKRMYWPAEVLQEEQALVKYTATSASGLADSVEISLPLKRANTIETTATGGQTQTSTTEYLEIPPDLVEPDLGELTVEVSASLLSQIEGGLDYTTRFPYECTEQVTSRILAALLNKQLNAKLGTKVLSDAFDADEVISTNLQKLYSRQLTDGGWPYWPKGNRSDPYLSVYTLFGLHRLKQAGVYVDEQVYQKAQQYLLAQLQSGNSSTESLARQAYFIYVDSLVHRGSVSYAQNLYQRYLRETEKFDVSTRVYLYLAMENLAQHSLNNRQVLQSAKTRLLNDLTGLVRRTATTARWEESSLYTTLASTTKATALMIQALLMDSVEHPLVTPTINYLMLIKKDGYWQTTHDTIHVLLALSEYMERVETGKPDYSYSIKLNEAPVLEGQFNPARILEQDTATVMGIPQLVGGERLPIGIQKQGSGTLYYHLNLQTFTPPDKIQPLDQGMAVDRAFFDQDGNEIDEVAAGETVTARITLVVPEDRHQVAIEDYLPAGMEAINVSFATEHLANKESFTRVQEDGQTGWPVWFAHREMRDDRVLVFVDFLNQGIYEFTYKMRATTPGTFTALPARAYELYQPDVFGSTGAAQFTIVQ